MSKFIVALVLSVVLTVSKSFANDAPLPTPPAPRPSPVMTVQWIGKIWNNVCQFYPTYIDCSGEQLVREGIPVEIPIYINSGDLYGIWSQSFSVGTHKYISQIEINKLKNQAEYSVFISLYELGGSWNSKEATANLFMKSLDQMLAIQVHGPTTEKYSENTAYIPFFKINPL